MMDFGMTGTAIKIPLCRQTFRVRQTLVMYVNLICSQLVNLVLQTLLPLKVHSTAFATKDFFLLEAA